MQRPAAFLAFLAILSALLVAAPTGDARAQSTHGMAIARSSDEGFQACHGDSADATLNCARQKCQKEHGGTCLRERWCYPAGYAGAMSYLMDRAVTHVTFLCGAPSETALLRMFAALCVAQEKASECRLMVLWTPDGSESDRRDLLGKNSAY